MTSPRGFVTGWDEPVIITYTPADGEHVTYDFDPDNLRQSEAEMIEKRMGGEMTVEQWRAAVLQGNSRARRVLLWHLMRTVHHALRYEDVPDFRVGELKVEMTLGELTALRDRVERSKVDTRDAMLAALDGEIEQRLAAGDVSEAPGKAS